MEDFRLELDLPRQVENEQEAKQIESLLKSV
jgi:hypothetical protein